MVCTYIALKAINCCNSHSHKHFFLHLSALPNTHTAVNAVEETHDELLLVLPNNTSIVRQGSQGSNRQSYD